MGTTISTDTIVMHTYSAFKVKKEKGVIEMFDSQFIEGYFFQVETGEFIKGRGVIQNGVFTDIERVDNVPDRYFFPGLIDAHIHIESSMLIPAQFAKAAVIHGTTATVSDPHEIANVLGKKGVDFMIENGASVPFKFFFGAPSCVPATPLETSGAVLDDKDVLELLQRDEVKYLAEMMDFPGVIADDPQVMAKLKHAISLKKPTDGHAPGLTGIQLEKYINSGISTDHECFTIEEAEEKASLGMKILIREGSAAGNFNDLIPLINKYPELVMLCSDDKHPDDLEKGHINLLVKRGMQMGYPLKSLIRACTLNPIEHYNLNCGLLRVGDPADFIEVNNLEQFNILATYINGSCVAKDGKALFKTQPIEPINNFNPANLNLDDLKVAAESNAINIIEAIDGQLVTKRLIKEMTSVSGEIVADVSNDILKLVVINRYHPAKPAIGFIHGFGLKEGAMASTVSHDSHNIIIVGTDDTHILRAYNLLVKTRGGLAITGKDSNMTLPLPIAGIMSDMDYKSVAKAYKEIDTKAKEAGSKLTSPFMTLSFMALLVIPELKLSDKGLFDGLNFNFIALFE